MFGAAYKQFAQQFSLLPDGEGLVYYRHAFLTRERTGFGPIPVTAAEAGGMQARFRWTARALVTLFVIAFLFLIVRLASVPGIGNPSDGSAGPSAGNGILLAYLGGMGLLFVLLGVGAAWAWRQPSRRLAARPALAVDPWPADAK